ERPGIGGSARREDSAAVDLNQAEGSGAGEKSAEVHIDAAALCAVVEQHPAQLDGAAVEGSQRSAVVDDQPRRSEQIERADGVKQRAAAVDRRGAGEQSAGGA